MIITESKPYGEIKSLINKTDKLSIISCNSCARMCETGGKKAMVNLANRLKEDGYNVVDQDLIPSMCDFDLLNKKELHGNVHIVLACDAGVENIKKLFPKHKVIDALDTVGLGCWDTKGNISIVRKFK